MGAGYNIPISLSASKSATTSSPFSGGTTTFIFDSPWASAGGTDMRSDVDGRSTATSSAANGNATNATDASSNGNGVGAGNVGSSATGGFDVWKVLTVAGITMSLCLFLKSR